MEEQLQYGEGSYEWSDILPLVAYVADKYTVKTTGSISSSIPYEAMQMLTEAVLYCLEEYRKEHRFEVASDQAISWKTIYDEGYQLVLYKVQKIKAYYHKLIKDFEDYHCKHYQTAILQELPRFFQKYDARFCPQETGVLLDYPVLEDLRDLNGADYIWEYLCCIRMEREFLKQMAPEAIKRVLSEKDPNYGENFLGNICYAVLNNMAGKIWERRSDMSEDEMIALLLERTCPKREDLQDYFHPVVIQLIRQLSKQKRQ